MLEKGRLTTVAELIKNNITISSVDQYCEETGISKGDFKIIEPSSFRGEVFAIDGSNVVVCDWSVARLNKICAGYAVYRGTDWQRTVVTYDDVFLADPENYAEQFEPFLKDIFKRENFALKESDLDRLSTYFRELQEYIALKEAIGEARPGDLILYDGGFDVFEPLRGILKGIIREAEKKGVDLLGVSKSSAIYWGSGVSRPFVYHTGTAGSMFAPEAAWYISIKGKRVKPQPDWDGGETFVIRFDGRSDRAFRVDMPSYMLGRAGFALGKLVLCSCSAECLGYPHALFRAHRDIRITDQEGAFLRLKLMDLLCDMGLGESQVRVLMQDYHDVMEMRQGI
jgi:hypothetical protein